MTPRVGRGGWLLAEILVAMVVGVAVLAALLGLVGSALAGERLVASRAEALDTVRTIWVVLEEELGAAVRGRDWTLDPEGAIALRAFRGFGRVCAADAGVIAVGYRGQRLPDPGRDSLLVLTVDGLWTAASFERAPPGGYCAAVEGEQEIGLSGVPETVRSPIVVRVFERGSYHLADGAFRYRRGGGGRQPLTAEGLAESSRFESMDGAVTAHVEVDASYGIGPFWWRLPAGTR